MGCGITLLMATMPVIAETPQSPATLSPSAALRLESDIIDFTNNLFETATSDHDYTQEVSETFKQLSFLDGKQWASGARYQRQRPILDLTSRHFWENVGLLTDLALDFQVKLFNKESDHSDLEDILNSLATHWAMRNQFEDRSYDVILYGLLHTGPSKIQWNSTLNGGLGDVQLVPIAPWQWATLGAGTNPQDAECIVYFPVVTKDHLIRRFGETAKRVDCDADYTGTLAGQFKRPQGMSQATWGRMGEAMRMQHGIKRSGSYDNPYPMALQKEFWLNDNSLNEKSFTVTVGPSDANGNPLVNWAYRVEPGMPLYPRGRVIITAGGAVMEDQPNPYWHAVKPFPVFRPFRLPWQMNGRKMMRSWMQMQSIINRIVAGTLDYIISVNEPTLQGPKGAMAPADWDAVDPGAPGGKIKTNNNAPRPLEFMKRAEYPVAPVFQYLNMIREEFNMQSGSSAIQQALGKKQVPGGDSLEMIMSSRSLPVRVESRSLASYLEEAGSMVIANMLQFYSVGHRVAILGSKGISASDYRPIYGQSIPEGMAPENFVRQFTGAIKRDTMLQSQKDNKIQVAFALRKMGDLSAKNLYKLLDINFNYEENKRELLEEARLKLLVAAASAELAGKGKSRAKK